MPGRYYYLQVDGDRNAVYNPLDPSSTETGEFRLRITHQNMGPRADIPPQNNDSICDAINFGTIANGASVFRNVGLLVSKGDWIAYLDDDDIWENDHIEKLYNLTQSKEDVEFVYGGYKRQNQDGTWTIRENPNFISGKKPFGGTFILHSSIMYRSYLSFQLYFTDSYKYGKALDYLFTQRIARSGIKWKFAKGVYAIQPLRPGEATTTYNSIKPFWPRGLDFILLPIIKRFNF